MSSPPFAGDGTSILGPIAGIDLARFAEISVRMRAHTGPDAWDQAADEAGVERAAWRQAWSGWTARLNDSATADKVGAAYEPLHRWAEARWGGASVYATFEEYVEMAALLRHGADRPSAWSIDPAIVYRRYGISALDWTRIAEFWAGVFGRCPDYAKRADEAIADRIAELDEAHARWQLG